jgi:hypothetical protein
MFPSSRIYRRVVYMWTDISEKRITSIFRVENHLLHAMLLLADFRSWWWRWYVPSKRRFAFGQYGAISPKMATFKHVLFTICLILASFQAYSKDEWDIFLRNVGWLQRLFGVISKKIELVVTVGVRNSNFTLYRRFLNSDVKRKHYMIFGKTQLELAVPLNLLCTDTVLYK